MSFEEPVKKFSSSLSKEDCLKYIRDNFSYQNLIKKVILTSITNSWGDILTKVVDSDNNEMYSIYIIDNVNKRQPKLFMYNPALFKLVKNNLNDEILENIIKNGDVKLFVAILQVRNSYNYQKIIKSNTDVRIFFLKFATDDIFRQYQKEIFDGIVSEEGNRTTGFYSLDFLVTSRINLSRTLNQIDYILPKENLVANKRILENGWHYKMLNRLFRRKSDRENPILDSKYDPLFNVLGQKWQDARETLRKEKKDVKLLFTKELNTWIEI